MGGYASYDGRDGQINIRVPAFRAIHGGRYDLFPGNRGSGFWFHYSVTKPCIRLVSCLFENIFLEVSRVQFCTGGNGIILPGCTPSYIVDGI